jgi:hypothetical protein
VSADIRPIPRPGWESLPFDGCVGVVGRVLVRDTVVICLEGHGFTSVAGETAALEEGQQARWPKGIPHRLWTEDATMTTLMVEHFD